jgi:hypothetical protein
MAMIKKKHHPILIGLGVLAAAAAGVWGYEKFYAATTVAPGVQSVPTPSSGKANLALPSGAKSWTSASFLSVAGGTATAPAVPTTPTTHLSLTGVIKGSSASVTYVDSNGATQIAIVNFT